MAVQLEPVQAGRVLRILATGKLEVADYQRLDFSCQPLAEAEAWVAGS